ncbi:hypothetical protein HS7_19610 [Sulfolobales archaeon HS-7]|nr:hypothetical protein HS7_19610 [Sulfolobales archaeon HS-7]
MTAQSLLHADLSQRHFILFGDSKGAEDPQGWTVLYRNVFVFISKFSYTWAARAGSVPSGLEDLSLWRENPP